MEFQIKERQNISNHCFVCGIKNPIGLQAKMDKLLRFSLPMRCIKAIRGYYMVVFMRQF